MSEKLPLSEKKKLLQFRGSRFSQCFILSTALHCSLPSKCLCQESFRVITKSTFKCEVHCLASRVRPKVGIEYTLLDRPQDLLGRMMDETHSSFDTQHYLSKCISNYIITCTAFPLQLNSSSFCCVHNAR